MDLANFSNYKEVLHIAKHYYGNDVTLLPSSRKNKKYMILNPNTNKFVHFGAMGYMDYTKYKQIDKERALAHRDRYLNRALNIKGKWKDNPYSPNYLSILLLWAGNFIT